MRTAARWIGREYRRLATGACYLLFLVAGAAVALVSVPILACVPNKSGRRQQIGLGLVRVGFRCLSKIIRCLGLVREIHLEGFDRIDTGPALVIANHPTLLDVVLILGHYPKCSCVVKLDLFSHPFLRFGIRNAGLIPNQGGEELMRRVEQEFRRGRSVLIFPEGTRSPPDGLRPFTRGPARVAIELSVQVVPIHVACSPRVLGKEDRWYRTPSRPPRFSLRVGSALRFERAPDEPPSLAVRRITSALESHYRQLIPAVETRTEGLEEFREEGD